jgi:hypothetical protein
MPITSTYRPLRFALPDARLRGAGGPSRSSMSATFELVPMLVDGLLGGPDGGPDGGPKGDGRGGPPDSDIEPAS